MTSKRYLLIGCGEDRRRLVDPAPHMKRGVYQARHGFEDGELYTLDSEPAFRPDLIANLESNSGGRWWVSQANDFGQHCLTPSGIGTSGRMLDNLFSEIHAYEVLEHLGRQGEVETFFASFLPIWHALEPDGLLCATCPSLESPWLWADPGHRRAIAAGSLYFLDRTHYPGPPSSDYRWINPCDFRVIWHHDDSQRLAFVLQAVKPARYVQTEVQK